MSNSESTTPPASPLLAPLEALIQRGVERSSTAAAVAAALDGRSLALRLAGTTLGIRLSVAAGRVSAAPASSEPADATLAGGPLGLLRLALGDPQAPVREGQVRVEGDPEVAGTFRELLAMVRPDIEEELSRVIGDVAAHEVGSATRSALAWAGQAAQSLSRSLSEYLREERRLLPSRTEVSEFLEAVDRLASDVERAEARLAALREQVEARGDAG